MSNELGFHLCMRKARLMGSSTQCNHSAGKGRVTNQGPSLSLRHKKRWGGRDAAVGSAATRSHGTKALWLELELGMCLLSTGAGTTELMVRSNGVLRGCFLSVVLNQEPI